MKYAFTVRMKDASIEQENNAYNPFWEALRLRCIKVVEQYRHLGKTKNRPHYHGIIESDSFFRYFSLPNLSIKFKKITDLKGWQYYCQHEQREDRKEIKARDILVRIMRGDYEPIKQRKISSSNNVVKTPRTATDLILIKFEDI